MGVMPGHYHALVVVPGRIARRGKSGRPLVDLGAEKPLRLEWSSKTLRLAAAHNLGREVLWFIWPRTQEGRLAGTSRVAHFKKRPLSEEAPEPGFYALGRLEAVNREEGFFELAVLPNPEGRLEKPFTLTVWAGLDVLETLPEPGAAVRVKGELRPKSLRLVAFEATEVPPPPVKPLARRAARAAGR